MSNFDFLNICEPIFDPYENATDNCMAAGSPEIPELEESALEPGSVHFKRVRKRRQNRESAARSRARKKQELELISQDLHRMTELNNKLSIQNTELKSENDTLKKELEFYKGLVKTKKNPRWLVAASTLTIVCILMISQGGTTNSAPKLGVRSPKSIQTDEFGGRWMILLLGIFALCLMLGVGWKRLN